MLRTKNTSAQKASEYYLQGHYQQGKSRWLGQGAKKWGLQGAIDNEAAFKNLCQGLSPDGGKKLNARSISFEQRRAALDCVLSTPKSISLTALVGGDDRLLDAENRVVEQFVDFIEQNYAQTRVMVKGDRQVIQTGNLIVASFAHVETRELDPHQHTHCLVMNATEADGKWYSLLNDAIVKNERYLGLVYRNFLAFQVQQLGYEIERKEGGYFEIKGYTPEQLEKFSKRRQQILAAAGINSTWVEREEAWAATRQPKPEVKLDELKVKWKEEAEALGIEFVRPSELQSKREPIQLTQEILNDAIAHCQERQVAFRLEDLEKFILSEHLGCDLSGLDALILENQELIRTPELQVRYTTQTARNRELATVRLMQQGQGKVKAIASPEAIKTQLDQSTLNAGQRQAVEIAATTTNQFIAWQGVAGAGKTYALKELLNILQAQGCNVKAFTSRAFAPSAQAAKVLETELGIEANTVARLLVSDETQETKPNSFWIVDEAGLLGAKDAFELLKRATAEKARVLLVGDTKQLSSVQAGNPFKSLQQAGISTAYLNQSQRQRHPQLKLAVDLVAQGKIEDGFDCLVDSGFIQEIDEDSKVREIVREYMSVALGARAETLVIATTNKQRSALTQALRTALKAEGSLSREDISVAQLKAKNLSSVQLKNTNHFAIGNLVMPLRDYKRRGLNKGELYEVTSKQTNHLTLKASDGTILEVDTGFKKVVYSQQQLEIAVGDRLKWTKNDRNLDRRNGQEFTVTAINGNTARIADEDGRLQSIDLSRPQHLDYALVTTTYSSQGKTAKQVLFTGEVDRESFYVAISRAKDELKIYTEDRNLLLKQALRSRANKTVEEVLSPAPAEKQVPEANTVTQRRQRTTLPIASQTQSSFENQIIPLPVKQVQTSQEVVKTERSHIPLPNKRQPIPAEPFWTPVALGDAPDSMEEKSWRELESSVIHPAIATLNFRSLKEDPIEKYHQAWEYLFYSDKLSRTNSGVLSAGILDKFKHIENGGWWCGSGVNPLYFANLKPGERPQEKAWGCFKPYTPREDADKPGKFIKYEHPLKTQRSIFLLYVPEEIAEKIYCREGIDPSPSDRASGFWYCVWKYNLPITITEGAKKAACLLSQGHAAIGLPGINGGYRTKDEHGNFILPRLHEELAVFATLGRQVTFCFDYDTRPKTIRDIERDIMRTGSLMQRQGVIVRAIDLPGPEKGVDDFINACGPLAYERSYRTAKLLPNWRKNLYKQFNYDRLYTPRNGNIVDAGISSDQTELGELENRSNQNIGIARRNPSRISDTDCQYDQFAKIGTDLARAISRRAEQRAIERVAGDIAAVSRNIAKFERADGKPGANLQNLHERLRDFYRQLYTNVKRIHSQLISNSTQELVPQVAHAIAQYVDRKALTNSKELAAISQVVAKFERAELKPEASLERLHQRLRDFYRQLHINVERIHSQLISNSTQELVPQVVHAIAQYVDRKALTNSSELTEVLEKLRAQANTNSFNPNKIIPTIERFCQQLDEFASMLDLNQQHEWVKVETSNPLTKQYNNQIGRVVGRVRVAGSESVYVKIGDFTPNFSNLELKTIRFKTLEPTVPTQVAEVADSSNLAGESPVLKAEFLENEAQKSAKAIQQLLQSVGKAQLDGSITFESKSWLFSQQENEVTLIAKQDSREILRVKGDRVLAFNPTAEEENKLRLFRAQVQKDLNQLEYDQTQKRKGGRSLS